MFFKSGKRNALIFISALLFAALITVIIMLCSVKVSLKLYVNGNFAGVVESVDNVDEMLQQVKDDLKAVAYDSEYASCEIRYGFATGKSAENIMSGGDLYRALYTASLSDYKTAYGVYANGEFIAANTDPSAVSDSVAAARRTAQGADGNEVELFGSIEVKSMYYPSYALRSSYELSETLQKYTDNLYKAVVRTDNSIVTVDVDATEDENTFLSPTGGQIVSSEVSDNGLVTIQLKVTEPVPFKTTYSKNSELYIGTYEKMQDGEDGLKEVVYTVTYKDGELVSSELTSEQIIVEPVSKIIDEGTKPKPATASHNSYQWPIKSKYILTDLFGGRYIDGEYSMHYGLDIACAAGTPIYAADGGVVIRSEYSSSYGYVVAIRHDNGQETLYAHMRKTPLVSVGDKVYQGQQLGEVGMTGYATGNHLHFEIKIDGERENPLKYLP